MTTYLADINAAVAGAGWLISNLANIISDGNKNQGLKKHAQAPSVATPSSVATDEVWCYDFDGVIHTFMSNYLLTKIDISVK